MKTTLSIYHAYIHSRLTYGIIIWGHCAGADRLFKLQRRAVRIIYCLSYRADCKMCFGQLGILTLPCQYIFSCLIYLKMFRDDYYTRGDTHVFNLRFQHHLNIDHHRLKRTQTGISYWGPKFYNKLPIHIQNLDVKSFKKAVKSFLLEKSYYSIKDYMSDSVCLYFDECKYT